MPIPGSATAEGTTRYRERFKGQLPRLATFDNNMTLWLSSIRHWYLFGNADAETDARYSEAVARSNPAWRQCDRHSRKL
jgi:hypothetical protein